MCLTPGRLAGGGDDCHQEEPPRSASCGIEQQLSCTALQQTLTVLAGPRAYQSYSYSTLWNPQKSHKSPHLITVTVLNFSRNCQPLQQRTPRGRATRAIRHFAFPLFCSVWGVSMYPDGGKNGTKMSVSRPFCGPQMQPELESSVPTC